MHLPIGVPLSDKFKLLRKRENNISQRQLAHILDIPKSTIGRIETGELEMISTEVFKKLADNDDLAKYAFWLLMDDIDDNTIDAMLAFRGKDQENDAPMLDAHPDLD